MVVGVFDVAAAAVGSAAAKNSNYRILWKISSENTQRFE